MVRQPDQADHRAEDLKWVVNTHWDKDHIACNPQWRREGAIVDCAQSCAQSAGDWEGRPDISLSRQGRAARHRRQAKIEMHGWGHAHAVGHHLFISQHAKVLHVADLFGWGLFRASPRRKKSRALRKSWASPRVRGRCRRLRSRPHFTIAHFGRFLAQSNQMLEKVPPLVSAGKSSHEISDRAAAGRDLAIGGVS